MFKTGPLLNEFQKVQKVFFISSKKDKGFPFSLLDIGGICWGGSAGNKVLRGRGLMRGT